MAKGFFTQGVAVLFEKAPSRAALRAALEPAFEIAREDDGGDGWAHGSDGLIVTYRPDVNGYVNVDVVHRPWPDHMGDPTKEPELFGAWTFGHFGPFAFPGNLERAAEQNLTWEHAGKDVKKHTAFVRVRLSYIFGAGGDAPVMPADCDALDELNFVYGIAAKLVQMPGAIAMFNPGGEVLTTGEMLERSLKWAAEHELQPLDVWANIRIFQVDDEWTLMDTVGHAQFDLPDLEAVFKQSEKDPNEVAALLRNITSYLLEQGPVIQDGHTVDGPDGAAWGVHAFRDALSSPPRDVLCLVPTEGDEPPELVFDRGEDVEEE